jgi:hypothetical protein
MGLIAYASSVTVTRVDLLSVVELTCRLSMWTSTEIAGWPNLRATRVACALGYCREIVHGTAVFTAALDPPATQQVSAPPKPCTYVTSPDTVRVKNA